VESSAREVESSALEVESSIESNGHQEEEPRRFSAEELREIFKQIDVDGDGTLSKLELINGVRSNADIAALCLPSYLIRKHKNVEVDANGLMLDDMVFEAVEAAFDGMACGKQKIKVQDFVAYFSHTEGRIEPSKLQALFGLMDFDGDGVVLKMEFVAAMKRHAEVREFFLPGVDCSTVMEDESTFEAIECIFQTMARGNRRISYHDVEVHFKHVAESRAVKSCQDSAQRRSEIRVLIIGPGYGLNLNPAQGNSIKNAGYQVKWMHDLPNPETPNFPVHQFLPKIQAEIEEFKPHVLTAASKGGLYVVRLWQTGLWSGPTVMINAHPACYQLPKDVPIVAAQGACDEVYRSTRAKVEELMKSGSKNSTFLYWLGSSGELAPGARTRVGDKHDMLSLTQYDCLPRLIESVLCPEGPEVFMVRSWRDRLSEGRRKDEEWLGYTVDRVRRRWASRNQRGSDDKKLWDVPRESEEFQHVERVFKAVPAETPAYPGKPDWESKRIVSVERIENGLQVDGSNVPYCSAVRRSLQEQGVTFEPGSHTVWTFHGANDDAIESIVSNPIAGIQPLIAGSRAANLWGSGTYLARDARYVSDGGFCGSRPDGSRRMLMCLTTTGMSCLGDPLQKGLLPYRQNPHRYDSSVDSLSAPEIYVVQHAGAVMPAYLITFA
jgi:Ca2+-binding EF-hand superfamily protein